VACADLKPHKQYVVYSGTERFSLGQKTEATGLVALATELQSVKAKTNVHGET